MNLTAPRIPYKQCKKLGTTRRELDRQILSSNRTEEDERSEFQGEAASSHNDDSTVLAVETDYINSLSRSGKL